MDDYFLEFVNNCIAKDDMHPFYVSTRWKHKRKDIFMRDHGECQACRRKGKLTVLQLNSKDRKRRAYVHHIKHLRDAPELALTDANLETLCFECHELEHIEERHQFENEKERYTNEERW